MYEKEMLNGYMQKLNLWNTASSSADEQFEQTVNSPIPNGGKMIFHNRDFAIPTFSQQ